MEIIIFTSQDYPENSLNLNVSAPSPSPFHQDSPSLPLYLSLSATYLLSIYITMVSQGAMMKRGAAGGGRAPGILVIPHLMHHLCPGRLQADRWRLWRSPVEGAHPGPVETGGSFAQPRTILLLRQTCRPRRLWVKKTEMAILPCHVLSCHILPLPSVFRPQHVHGLMTPRTKSMLHILTRHCHTCITQGSTLCTSPC